MSSAKRSLTIAVLTAVLAGAPLAGGATESEEIIKYRQKAMDALGGHMGAMAQIMRGKVDFRGHMAAHAEGVAGVAGHVTAMFPEGSDFGDTKAKMAVWDEWEKFEQAAKESKQAADDLVAAVGSGDDAAVGEAFKALGETCKGCHKDFRQKDD